MVILDIYGITVLTIFTAECQLFLTTFFEFILKDQVFCMCFWLVYIFFWHLRSAESG